MPECPRFRDPKPFGHVRTIRVILRSREDRKGSPFFAFYGRACPEHTRAGGPAFGRALARWMLPTSDTAESSVDGGARFDVPISMPLAGLLVRCEGWLKDATHSAGHRR